MKEKVTYLFRFLGLNEIKTQVYGVCIITSQLNKMYIHAVRFYLNMGKSGMYKHRS